MIKLTKYIKIFFINLIIITIIYNVNTYSVTKLLNQEKKFLRLSEKYDTELNKKWIEILDEKEKIIKQIKKNNQYDKYKEYTNNFKNSKLFRNKTKYIRQLNQSVKENNDKKIKRYLTLLLNIFLDENENIKEYFDINHISLEYIKSNILFKSSVE
ncbi:hypothetical protein [Candidatus Arthromitus sp. SFB-rat-Yit]|uniref:hypothetical protein n=1 Tax=Candidatus Arthromitus sp. SFB-rat-Yit TaxID=1041504 RepID=UPI000227A855|nr:hypothetical protein [Candidatus Arthromitus sp. SFB-rat-Yit]BAK81900.1 hypothetical protein RATSFB_1338 [Candidatus Arthromitus sp. SFB-rat-Yit]